jgi:hypothetical protein
MKAREFKRVDSPEAFFKAIPESLSENVLFRISLHKYLAGDKEAQRVYLAMCDAKPQIAFNSSFFTYDPRQPIGLQARPFILRPQQDLFVSAIKDAIDNQHDLAVDKTREEGATEVLCKMFSLYFLLRRRSRLGMAG